MSLSSFFKDVYRQIFYIKGPQRCDQASNIVKAFNGCQEQLYDSSTTHFDVPETVHGELSEFFLEKSFCQIPAITVNRIPGGSAYAGGAVISPDGVTVARDLSTDFSSSLSDHFLCGTRIQRPLFLKGTTLCVTSGSTSSYYHWLLEELPRCLLLANKESFDNIIFSRDTATSRLSLELLGFSKVPTVYTDVPNKLIGRHYSSELLVSPSYVNPTGHPSPLLVQLLTSFVEPLISKSNSYPQKIFITRKNAKGRRLINEDIIFPMFESAGYVSVKLEDLTWQEQINLFYHAREIFAPHGAGLANLVFCANSPLVIELFNSQYVHWCFWKLANLVGAQYIPIALPSKGNVAHNSTAYCLADIQMTTSDIAKICCAASL